MAIAVSAAFKEALNYSHTIALKVEIYHAGVFKLTLDKVTGGYVTIKRDDDNRRTAYITVTDDTGIITPDGTINSTINLYNCEFKLFRGIAFPDGTVEYVSLGVFTVNAIEVAESGQGLYLKVSGTDLSRRVQRAKLTKSFVIANGTNAISAIQNILSTSYSRIAYGRVDISSFTLPSLVFGVGSDPWVAALGIANRIGFDIYFDNEGLCVIKAAVNPLTAITSWEYVEGATCTMLSQQKYYDDDEKHNWIVVTGENTSTGIIRAEAKDDNPTSPTYVNGPYGKVVKIISASDIGTLSQAQALANRELLLAMGGTEMLYLVTVPNPAVDIDDVVYCKRVKAKTDDHYIVDQMTIPLSAEAAANVGIRKRVSPNA